MVPEVFDAVDVGLFVGEQLAVINPEVMKPLTSMGWLGFNMSVAVAVGFIALAGVAAETGVVLLIYLEQAMAEVQAERVREDRLPMIGGAVSSTILTLVVIPTIYD